MAATAASPAGAIAMLAVDDLAGLTAATDHDVGDRLLNSIEDTLRRSLPSGLALERMDCGRFLVWLPETDIVKAEPLIESLRATASTTYVEAAQGIAARTLSAGLVVTVADQCRARAVRHAGSAVARARTHGGNRLEVVHTPTFAPAGPTRADVESGIRTGALSYYVQPIFDVTTGQAVGVEALLRWQRTDGTVLGPATFIDHLDHIPAQACDLFPRIATQAAEPFVSRPQPLFFTLNISAAVLDGKGSVSCRWLSEVLDHLPPEQIVVEIVETAIIAHPARALDLVTRLRARGVRVALDDFGTGLSNLDRLRQLPVDFLKIDRVFVDGLGRSGREEAILRNLVRMSADLGIEIIAEGIEDEHQAKAIKDMGIRYAQGFYLGRPGPVADWEQRLI